MTALPQHLQALETANRVRIARSNLKRKVRAGELTVVEVLTNPPSEALTMSLLELLTAQTQWGRTRALKLVREAAMSETRRIGEMTERQRFAVAMYLADVAKRHAREDARNEVARLGRHENEVRRVTNDRWWRRLSPLLPCDEVTPSDDWDGAIE